MKYIKEIVIKDIRSNKMDMRNVSDIIERKLRGTSKVEIGDSVFIVKKVKVPVKLIVDSKTKVCVVKLDVNEMDPRDIPDRIVNKYHKAFYIPSRIFEYRYYIQGVAKCNPEDDFDVYKGLVVAKRKFMRAMNNYLKHCYKDLDNECKYILEGFSKEVNRYRD